MPSESHIGFFTRSKRENAPLAHSIIRGLFYRSRMKCKLKMIILPKTASEGEHEWLLPFYSLSSSIPEVIAAITSTLKIVVYQATVILLVLGVEVLY